MKFGLLVNRNLLNLGDDIQSYAESQFLPRIDYLVDREYINDFKPDAEEPVAVIMGAWWMRHKWNFPPSKYVKPLWVSMHLTNFNIKQNGSPVQDELFQGVGGQYMNDHAPIGTRDMATLKTLQDLGIDSYFSGCVTLTLPKQPLVKPKKEYVCLVDLDPKVEQKVIEDLEGSGLEIRKMSHQRPTRRTAKEMDDWNFRKSEVEEILSTYQNAKCVVTRRLHAALPCLAMEVPVLCVHFPKNIRFSPYNEWLHMVSPKNVIQGNYDYDFANPKPNKQLHLETRERLAETMRQFAEEMEADTSTLEKVYRPSYTEHELLVWQNELMRNTLNKWLKYSIQQNKAQKKTSTSKVSVETMYQKLKLKLKGLGK